MNKKDLIQDTILLPAWEKANCKGTIVASLGAGKTYCGLKAIKQKEFESVAIIVPNLKLIKNWIYEIRNYFNVTIFSFKGNNYQYLMADDCFIIICTSGYFINLSESFEFIILDEINKIFTSKRGSKLIEILKKFSKYQIMGLTGTPEDNKPEKKAMYEAIAPICVRYHTAEEDKLINKKKHLVLNYELTNEFDYTFQTKYKTWKMGEKDGYAYIEKTIQDNIQKIKDIYWFEVQTRIDAILKLEKHISSRFSYLILPEYKKFLRKLKNKNLDVFKRVKSRFYHKFRVLFDNKKSTKPDIFKLALLQERMGFYWIFKYIIDTDYAVFGIDHLKRIQSVPQSAKPYSFKYFNGLKERIKFLSTLTSSVILARRIKRKILENEDNKVIIFSKLSEQADLLSKYTVHSNNPKDLNDVVLENFKSGVIKEVACINMLSEGMNIKGLNYGLHVSFDSSNTKNKQKNGRLARLKVDDIANSIYLVPKDTQTEVWFNNLNMKLNFITNDIEELLKEIK